MKFCRSFSNVFRKLKTILHLENDHFQIATGTTKTSGRLLDCLTANIFLLQLNYSGKSILQTYIDSHFGSSTALQTDGDEAALLAASSLSSHIVVCVCHDLFRCSSGETARRPARIHRQLRRVRKRRGSQSGHVPRGPGCSGVGAARGSICRRPPFL